MSAFWITLAALGLVFMVVAIGRIARAYRPDPELGGLPVTPLERLGWVGLAVTGGVAAGMAILVLVFGVEGFHGQSAARFSFWLLLLAGVGIWTVVWYWTRRDAGSLVVDERDRAVLARSFDGGARLSGGLDRRAHRGVLGRGQRSRQLSPTAVLVDVRRRRHGQIAGDRPGVPTGYRARCLRPESATRSAGCGSNMER
jgi:hypothetical protein